MFSKKVFYSKYGVISGPYFPVFGLNAGRYGVFVRIQSEYRKIRTRNNSEFGYFSRSIYGMNGLFKTQPQNATVKISLKLDLNS